jgi:hypothetical protein
VISGMHTAKTTSFSCIYRCIQPKWVKRCMPNVYRRAEPEYCTKITQSSKIANKGKRRGRSNHCSLLGIRHSILYTRSFILVTHLINTAHLDPFNYSDYLYHLVHRLILWPTGKLRKTTGLPPLFRHALDLHLDITIRPLKSVPP